MEVSCVSDDPFGDLDDSSEDGSSADGRFDELDDELGEALNEGADSDVVVSSGGIEADPEPEQEPEPDPYEEPAFSFDATKQTSLYPLSGTVDKFEDTYDIEVVPQLRRNGLKDITTSEYHDAALRVAAENPELVTRKIRERRGVEE